LVSEVTAEMLAAQVSDPILREAYRRLGVESFIVAPLWARGRVIGNVSFVRAGRSRPAFGELDAATATELARRTALSLDNARLLARERAAALTLQRSLLPDLPTIAGVTVAARYRPADAHSQIGGDWYDVLPLPDGSVGIAIGDVMGHDLDAAAAMGQLRSVLRGYAWDGDDPATVLHRLDRLVTGLGMAQLATAVYGRMQLEPSGNARLDYANAGHPPPVLRRPDGTTEVLTGGHAPLIGLPIETERDLATLCVEAGSILVLYTDGLVEDSDRPAEEGVAALRSVLETAPADAGPEELCDLVLSGLSRKHGHADDVALLILRLDPPA
jgi:serine phosphatase RsbU (regulator of sigma subunit)